MPYTPPITPTRPTRPVAPNAPNRQVKYTHIMQLSNIVRELKF
jgi:hypothetical protein